MSKTLSRDYVMDPLLVALLRQPGSQLYTGPDHIRKPLKGRYFNHSPNQYYHKVEIQEDKIQNLPEEAIQFPELKIVDMDKDIPERKRDLPRNNSRFHFHHPMIV